MKSLQKFIIEPIQQTLNESIEGQLQTLTSGLQAKADDYGMIRLKHWVPLGENDACIDAIDVRGDMVRVEIGGNADAVRIKYFTDEILKDVITELKKM